MTTIQSYYVDRFHCMAVFAYDNEIAPQIIEKLTLLSDQPVDYTTAPKTAHILRSEFWNFLSENLCAPSVLSSIGDTSDGYPNVWNGYPSEHINAVLDMFPNSEVIEMGQLNSELLKIGARGLKSFAVIGRCSKHERFFSFDSIPDVLKPFVQEMSGLSTVLNGHSFPEEHSIAKLFKFEEENISVSWTSRKKQEVFDTTKINKDDYLSMESSGRPITCFA